MNFQAKQRWSFLAILLSLQQEDGAYIDWRPADELPPDLDFEVQSYLSGKFEWDVVTTQPSPQGNSLLEYFIDLQFIAFRNQRFNSSIMQ